MTDIEQSTPSLGAAIRLISAVIGLVFIVLGCVFIIIPRFLEAPGVSVPVGKIDSVQGQVTACQEDYISGRYHYIGELTYQFTYNDKPYTNMYDSGVSCSMNPIGGNIAVYFIESDPVQSSPNEKHLYAIPTSPLDYAAFASWGLGLLLVFPIAFKFLRSTK